MADGSQVSLVGVPIGVVENNRDLLIALDESLSAAGYTVQRMKRGSDAEACVKVRAPALMIVDWSLPDLTGAALLRRLREVISIKAMPIMVLTACATEHEIVEAFEAGADDLMLKPFSAQELVARVEALLRRRSSDTFGAVLKVGDVEFDRSAMCVRRRGRIVELGPINIQLIQLFLAHPGKILGRQQILEAVWGAGARVDVRTIDVHVGRLRKALLAAWRTDPIATHRGLGYRYRPR